MSDEQELQREITRAALIALDGRGFALAGSGAIREHGIVDRPTRDVDLFTNDLDPAAFESAVDQLTSELRGAGHTVDELRRAPQFAQLQIRTESGQSVDMDLAVDWRELEPVALSVGPVLSLEDAVGSKVGALYSRAAERDFLDVDSIRASGHFTDAQLMTAAAERDAGFDTVMFAGQLEQVNRVRPEMVARYGVDADQLVALQGRLTGWAAELRGQAQPTATEEQVERVQKFANLDVPLRGSDLTKPPNSSTKNAGHDTTMNHDTGMGRQR